MREFLVQSRVTVRFGEPLFHNGWLSKEMSPVNFGFSALFDQLEMLKKIFDTELCECPQVILLQSICRHGVGCARKSAVKIKRMENVNQKFNTRTKLKY